MTSAREKIFGKQARQEAEEKMKAQDTKTSGVTATASAVADLQREVETIISDEKDFEEDFPLVYGSDRTKRAKTMLSLHRKNNKKTHIPYIRINKVDCDNSQLLEIFTGFAVYSIHGKNLDFIAERIKHGSLSYINEGGERPPVTPDGVCVYQIIDHDFINQRAE